ncbi:hypothetical protein PEC302110_16500 [Pectobacterium araliae]|uniref:TonB-dependent receptor n=1 Tax=Pectobacterium araliae TaxID=3073862 RepID=A0AAN0ML89_9GAMM|nr:hypothetical protein PEC302110_16500 [Pectobacterium sp. MAFF 302110]
MFDKKLNVNYTLKGAVNNLLDKDFTSGIRTYGSGRGAFTTADYYSFSRVTSGSVQSGRNYWLSVNVNF